MTIRVRSYRRAGRLTPAAALGLRAGSVVLAPRGVMHWHSTKNREELLIVLGGRLQLEIETEAQRIQRVKLLAGSVAHVPPQTAHRLVNQGTTDARYVYVTSPSAAA